MTDLLFGFLGGILLSIPPGPGGYFILSLALKKQNRKARKAAFGILAGDLIVLLCSFGLFQSMMTLVNSWIFEIAAGIFLLTFFAIGIHKSLHPKKKGPEITAEKKGGAFRRALSLTAFNPAIWLGLLSIMAVASPYLRVHPLLFMVAFEVGALAWYFLLILFSPIFKERGAVTLQRCALVCIGGFGIYFIVKGFDHLGGA